MARLDSRTDGGWGWVVVAASFAIFFIMDGAVNAYGVVSVELLDQLGISRQMAGWISAVRVAATLCGGPAAGLVVGRLGCRTAAMIGAVVSSVGYAASAFVGSGWHLLVTYGCGVGFGMSLIYLPALVTLGVYFDRLRSTASGIASCGSGLGTLALSPLIVHLIQTYTWRGCFQLLAGIMLNCAVMTALFRPLAARSQAPDSNKATGGGLRLQEPVKATRGAASPALAAFLASNLLSSLGFSPPFVFAPDWARRSAGASPVAAGLLVAGMGAANTLGRAALGLLADRAVGQGSGGDEPLLDDQRRRRRRLIIYGAALCVAGLAQAMGFASSAYGYMAFCCSVFGFSIGAYTTLTAPVLIDLVGLDRLGDWLGLALLSQGIGGLAGAPLAGFIIDASDSYGLAFGVCGGCVFLGGLAAFACLRLTGAASDAMETAATEQKDTESCGFAATDRDASL